MLIALIMVLLVGGGGVILYTMRRQGGSNPLAVTARLSRYGLIAPGAVKVVTNTGAQRSGMSKTVNRMVEGQRFAAPITAKLERADLKMTPGEWLTLCVVVFLVAMLIGLIIKGFLGLLIAGVVSLIAPWIYLTKRGTRRRRAFIGQLADMAQMMGNSMRAGFSIIQSMEMVGSEGPSPASDEFERVVTEVKLGLPLDQALEHLLQRQPSEDLSLMVVAINVQRQIGGNLSEILAVISETIRERVRFERDLRALTAQARYSSYIITALPVGVAIVINFMDHPYESYLYTAMLGHLMLGLAVCMLGMGFFFLNKIANIEV